MANPETMTGEQSGRPVSTRPADGLRWVPWHLAALVVVLVLPTLYGSGRSAWAVPRAELSFALWGGIGYLLAAAFAAPTLRRSRMVRLAGVATSVVVAFAAVASLSLPLPELPLSRRLLGYSAILSLAFLVIPALIGRVHTLALAALVTLAGGTVWSAARVASVEDFAIETQFYRLSVRVHRSPLLPTTPVVEGGGLSRVGAEMLLATGSGEFMRVTPVEGGSLGFEPLSQPSPANAEEFRADVPAGVAVQSFRVMDVLAEPTGDSVFVTVTHHYWHREDSCFVVRVSTATVSSDLQRWSPWQTLFDTEPCLPLRFGGRGVPFSGTESGGRLLRIPEGLLLTVGDHKFDGYNAPTVLAQDPESHYGKTILIQPDGAARVFTLGHRNPQGLTLDRDGNIWSTEHGPRGGDELNLIEAGANYGWPWRTLGTEYAMRHWPPLRPPDPAYREPVIAFVPSPATSGALALHGDRFPLWEGSVLIPSLKNRELRRVQLDGTEPRYVETMGIAFEVRDLEEAADGSLVAWTDHGALLTIDADTLATTGDALIEACAACHTLNPGQNNSGLAPNLNGVVGRRVGALAGFPYSPALSQLGGRWTVDRLDAFLADPAGYAPGTTMGEVQGIADAAQRRAIIEFLQGDRR